MKYDYLKIAGLADSYINGNKGYVREQVKKLNKVEFVLLCSAIQNLTDNTDIDQIAFKLTLEG